MSESLKQGFNHFRAGRLKEASRCFEQVLVDDPKNAEALNNLGVIAYQQKEVGRAAQFFSQALELDPFYVDALLNLCQVLRDSDRLAQALPLLEAVGTRYPDNEDIAALISEIRSGSQFAATPAVQDERATDEQATVEIELRKFPYPYRAAFSISNDIDLTSWQAFKDIYSFLCSTEETSLGQGLGLPLSSSFFLFNFSKQDQFAYFANAHCTDGPQREQIDHLIKTGYLDNIHGFGSFTHEQPFRRELAERAYAILASRDLHLPIWSCHGDESSTAQVDSSGQVADANGDLPDTPEYHFDLTKAHGVRYLWQWHQGGISNVIGQEQGNFVEFGNKQFVPISEAGRKHYHAVDRMAVQQAADQNRLLTPVTLRDGRRIYNFRRFNAGLRRCNAATLAQQLRPEFLTELIQSGAYLILYQHLGGARTTADGPPLVNQSPYFDDQAKAALLYVSELHHARYLWVAPVAALLDYNHLTRHAHWHAERKEDQFKIVIEKVVDPFLQDEWIPTAEQCAGLTFYTPDPDRTRVFINTTEIETLQRNAADHLGRASVTVPLRRMPDFVVD